MLKQKVHNKGFTLIELLVVILLAGILATLAVSTTFKQINKAKEVEAITFIRRAMSAATELNSEGVLPTDLSDLLTITTPLRYYSYSYKQNFMAFKGKQGATYAVIATPLESGLRTYIGINLATPLNGSDSTQLVCRSKYPNVDASYLLVGININELKCSELPGDWNDFAK